MPVLTFIDITGIQEFVFLSNRLSDAVAGSVLVERATGRNGVLSELAPKNGGEVIIAAGGNAQIRFGDMASARRFAAEYSRGLFERAPGLEAVIRHREYADNELARTIKALQRDITKAKLTREPSARPLGLSVTAECSETRLPATCIVRQATDEPPILAASSIEARRCSSLRQSSDPVFPSFQEGKGPVVDLIYPLDIDNLGRSRTDTSLIGVVHVDGNRMGSRLAQWLEEQSERGVSDEVLEAEYRKISGAIDELSKRCSKAISERIRDAIRWRDGSSLGEGSTQSPGKAERAYVLHSSILDEDFPLKRVREGARDVVYLPVRPIIAGGDDITFVCDGRIALDLAETMLRCFMENPIYGLEKVTASAGVAIGKSHAPFKRLYDVAERLCQSAKHHLHEQRLDDSCMDWHIGLPRVDSIDALRKQVYTSPDGAYRLTCRPYPLGTSPDQAETWTWLSETILGSRSRNTTALFGEDWQRHRTKLNSLRTALINGPDVVEKSVESWNVLSGIPRLPGGNDLARRGFIGRHTPFLDAIELIDIHFPLGKE